MRTRWGVLISGNGSTLQALLDCRDLIDISVVISSKPQAYGILRARRAGVPVEILPSQVKGSAPAQKEEAEKWIISTFEKYRVQNVFLAGFMRIVSPTLIKKYEGRIFNVHPSLLPLYKGLDGLGQALKAGETHAGATIHHVDLEVDSGQIVSQGRFEIPKTQDSDLSRHLSYLRLHVHEQRLLRQSMTRILWQNQQMS